MKIIDLFDRNDEIEKQIIKQSGCKSIAIANISTSTKKTVYVTDNGHCYTHGRYQNKESLTEVRPKERYGRMVFLFNKRNTIGTLFGAAELIYCSFYRLEYDKDKRCKFYDGNYKNLSLANLYVNSNTAYSSKSLQLYSNNYAANYRRLVRMLHYMFYGKISFENCKDIASDVFIYLCLKIDSDKQKNPINDFFGIWLFWSRKFALSRRRYQDKVIEYMDQYMRCCNQDESWDIYRLIKCYIPSKYHDIAQYIAKGYNNEDIAETFGCTIEKANSKRSNLIRLLRKIIIK